MSSGSGFRFLAVSGINEYGSFAFKDRITPTLEGEMCQIGCLKFTAVRFSKRLTVLFGILVGKPACAALPEEGQLAG